MGLICGSCLAPFLPEDLDLRAGVGRCRLCGSVVPISEAGLQPGFFARPALLKGVTVVRGAPAPGAPSAGGGARLGRGREPLEVRVRRFSVTALVLGLISVTIYGIFLPFFVASFFKWGVLFSLLFILCFHVGLLPLLLTIYGSAVLCINTITVKVEGGWLTVRHHPLPWPGRRDIPVASVREIHQRRDPWYSNRVAQRFGVWCETTNRGAVKLLSGLGKAKAAYLAWVLSQHLSFERALAGSALRPRSAVGPAGAATGRVRGAYSEPPRSR